MFEFCSGLVDLVICVLHHLGGGHRLALAGERFVGLVAEHIAEVGDRGVDLRKNRPRIRAGGDPADGGGGFVVPQPVQEGGEYGQRAEQEGEIARVVVVADRKGEKVTSIDGITLGGRKPREDDRNDRDDISVTAVLSYR
jgi:hypothetical protein